MNEQLVFGLELVDDTNRQAGVEAATKFRCRRPAHPARLIPKPGTLIRCAAQTLHEWVKKAEVDSGRRVGVPTEVAAQVKALERENRELRQANEILSKASAYFVQAELDLPFKR